MTVPLLQVRGLTKTFPARGGAWSRSKARVRAVEEVDLHVDAEESVAVVGESGCGKTTLGRAILRLHEPDAGEVRFGGPDAADVRDVRKARGSELRRLRREMQIVFQDPYSSLNPRMRVRDLVGEAMLFHGLVDRSGLRDAVAAELSRVGLDPTRHLDRYPHEFSGGQRQRIGIARALAVKPRFLVLDEAVSALDVSVQAQILNLLLDIRRELGLAWLFISHDLAVVRQVTDRVLVMYLGQVVEEAPTETLFARPGHPYTRALLSAVPRRTPEARERIVLKGDLPSPSSPPSGCRFHTRCPLREAICETDAPPWRDAAEGHRYRCHFDTAAPT